jgi:rhodanese-related sulfurtransferase
MKLAKFYIFIFITMFLCSCLENPTNTNVLDNLETGAEILNYFEVNGDFINSYEMPSIKTADEVFDNLENLLIIDVRESDKFGSGHIEGSINLHGAEILNYIEGLDNNENLDIVLISSTGEAAAYYNCLLRLLGYENTYALKHGMAAWNNNFSSIWLNSIRSNEDFNANYLKFNDITYEKGRYNNLPKINFSDNRLEVSQKIYEQISGQFQTLFIEREINASTTISDIKNDSVVSISFESLYQNLDQFGNEFKNIYLICYGGYDLYRPINYHLGETNSHPPASVWYNATPFSEISSVNYLQTIPNDRMIIVYSISGISSAYVIAYLRVLGYNAKSLQFGASGFHYKAILNRPQLWEFMFREENIRDYPYISGN